MALTLTINGTGRAFRVGSLSLRQSAKGIPTLSIEIVSVDASYRPAIFQSLVLAEDGTDIFGGTIDGVDESGAIDRGALTAILLKVTAVGYAEYAARRFVSPMTIPVGTTTKAALDLVAPYLAPYGVSVDTGSSILALPGEIRIEDYTRADAVIDAIAGSNNLIWDILPNKHLKAWAPGDDVAPFDVTESLSNMYDDLEARPTRDDYVNRVIVRYWWRGGQAYAFLGSGGPNFNDGETVTIGSKEYTFQTTLTEADGHIQIGVDVGDSLTRLALAMAGIKDGVIIANATTAHTQVQALMFGPTLKAIAIEVGAAGNAIGVASTAVSVAWFTEGGGVTSTLGFGADAGLTNYGIPVDNTTEQGLYGIFEQLIDVKTAFNESDATAAGTAYLAGRIYPNIVTYATRRAGIIPGMSQTITVPKRNVSGAHLLTEITLENPEANVLVRHVTAIKGSSVGGSWRDVFRIWAGAPGGGGGSSAVAVQGGGSGGGGGTVAVPTAFRATLGVIRDQTTLTTDWTWVPDYLPVVLPSVPATGAYRLRAEIWARDTGVDVQAALFDITGTPTLVAASVSEVVTSQTPTEVTVNVNLTADHKYALVIKSDPAGEYVGGLGQLEGIGGGGGGASGGGLGAPPPDYNVVVWVSGSSLGTNNLTVVDGEATIDAAVYISPDTYVGGTLEWTATFAGGVSGPAQHVGFSNDFINAPWIIISTHSGSDLEARTFPTGGPAETMTVIDASGATTFGVSHDYKIVWTSGVDAKYYIDGVLKATHAVAISTAQHVMMSDFGLGTNGTFLIVSNVKINGVSILL